MASWPAFKSRVTVDPSNKHRIVFPDILGNPWYDARKDLKVRTIQYRKEFRAPFRHEYLVVSLSDGSICRFDRRPKPGVSLDALKEHGSEAYDTVEEITSSMLAGPTIQKSSVCLATLTFRDELDLFFVFLICYGIQSDPQAVRYTLLQYNCYFFSWTIILNIARNSVTWEGLPSFASFKSLPDNIASELSEMLVHKLLGQSTTICNDLVHEVLAQLADLLPSRLSVRSPHLGKSLQSLPHLLRSAADPYSPTSMIRWKYLKIKMFNSLEYTLTHDVIRRKLLKHIRRSIRFSGRPGDPLCDVLNHVLRRTLWRHNLSRVVRKATTGFLRHGDPDEESFPSIDSVLWDSVAEIISREVIYTFQENVLSTFVDLVHRVVTDCAKQSGIAAIPDMKASLDSISGVVRGTIDASMSDALKESLSNVVWEAAGRGKEVNKAIARAMGSVVADILQDSQLPFALKVRNPWSIRDPVLLKSEIHWHVARWAKKATTGVDVQVSHMMLEQYFEYRIVEHSRGVRRLDVVKGHTIHTKKELGSAMQRVWEVVSGMSYADGDSDEESRGVSDDDTDEGCQSSLILGRSVSEEQ